MGHHRILLFLLLGLLLTIITISTSHAQDAAAVTQGGGIGGGVVGRSNSGMMSRAMVGSRPPSCAGRCWWCGGRGCVAVQVPVSPQQDNGKIPPHHAAAHGGGGRGGGASSSSSSSAVEKEEEEEVSLSYDDRSNYKPLSWRCKCGGAVDGLDP